MKRKLKRLIVPILFLLLGLVTLDACTKMGQPPEEASMATLSTNYRQGKFVNSTPVNMDMGGSFMEVMGEFFSSKRLPKSELPMMPLKSSDFGEPDGLSVTWLGHSSTILEIDGVRLIIDPVFGNASPIPYTVRRFQDGPIRREDLPRLDAVVISHDHYDHLEMKTAKHFIAKGTLFIVPLGVGSHLRKWGCLEENLIELDWWQHTSLKGVEIHATPARHFSGRGLTDRFKTLWASWAFIGKEHRVYYSGDGGYDDRFSAIGEKLGPFDLTIMENGAYNKAWPDVHMFPEEAVRAHLELGGRYMLPVHWGAYDLSAHHWSEPGYRVARAAEEQGAELVTPVMGRRVEPGKTQTHAWWEKVSEPVGGAMARDASEDQAVGDGA